MNEVLLLVLCHLNCYLLGNKRTVLFPLKKKKKRSVFCAGSQHPHTCVQPCNHENPHVGTKQTPVQFFLQRPTHTASTFTRKCRLIHTHAKKKQPTLKNTHLRRKGCWSSAACPLTEDPQGQIRGVSVVSSDSKIDARDVHKKQ